jgi:hypothetical protein
MGDIIKSSEYTLNFSVACLASDTPAIAQVARV